jgi:hypothetical protein
MNAPLQYGRRYRARVAVDPFAKLAITPEMIATELARWQLYGQVTDIPSGYQLEAEFRGQSGTYPLPEEVEALEIIG